MLPSPNVKQEPDLLSENAVMKTAAGAVRKQGSS